MAQVIPRFDLGSEIGKAAGTGLGQGLQNLANLKLKEFQQRQQAGKLEEGGLPGVLAHLDPQVQAAYLRNAQAAQTESQKANIDAELLQQLSSLQQGDGAPSNLSAKNVSGAPIEQVESLKPSTNIAPKSGSQEARLKRGIDDLQSVVDNPNIDSRVRSRTERQLQDKNKRFDKLSNQLFSATKDVRDEVTNDLKDNAELRATLEVQKDLNEKGNMDTAGYLSFLKNAGFSDVDALKNDDTQTFIKSNGIHLRNLKKLFGGRITQSEMQTYMKTIANEYQSPEGRRRILDMMLINADASDIRGQTMEDIIQENGGLPPRDLKEKIERRSRSDIRDIYKQFKEIINRSPLKGQNKLITAAQSAAGKAVPMIGGATLGAGLGSLFGPGGTTAGALIGGAAPGVLSSLKDLLSKLGG